MIIMDTEYKLWYEKNPCLEGGTQKEGGTKDVKPFQEDSLLHRVITGTGCLINEGVVSFMLRFFEGCFMCEKQ